MAERTSYKPGTPSWVDIGVPDTDKAAEFYGAVFGWDAAIDPRPEAGGYGMFTLRGLNVAGLGPQQNPDMPPYWSVYITRGRRRRDARHGRCGGRHHHRRADGRVRRRAHGRRAGSGRLLRLDVAAQSAHRRPTRERDRHVRLERAGDHRPPRGHRLLHVRVRVGASTDDSSDGADIFTVDGDMVCGAHTAGEGEFPAWSIWFTVDDVRRVSGAGQGARRLRVRRAQRHGLRPGRGGGRSRRRRVRNRQRERPGGLSQPTIGGGGTLGSRRSLTG